MIGKLIAGGIVGGAVLVAGTVARTILMELAGGRENWSADDVGAALPGALNRLTEDGLGHAKSIVAGLKERTGSFVLDVILHDAKAQMTEEQTAKK